VENKMARVIAINEFGMHYDPVEKANDILKFNADELQIKRINEAIDKQVNAWLRNPKTIEQITDLIWVQMASRMHLPKEDYAKLRSDVSSAFQNIRIRLDQEMASAI